MAKCLECSQVFAVYGGSEGHACPTCKSMNTSANRTHIEPSGTECIRTDCGFCIGGVCITSPEFISCNSECLSYHKKESV